MYQLGKRCKNPAKPRVYTRFVLSKLCKAFFGCWRSPIRMGYEARKRVIAGVLVSFCSEVALLMVRCQRRKGVLQSFLKTSLRAYDPYA